jgi:hypothetical protein
MNDKVQLFALLIRTATAVRMSRFILQNPEVVCISFLFCALSAARFI